MNQNLDEAIYTASSYFFLILAFTLFLMTYQLMLHINDISYKFTVANDADVYESYDTGLDTDEVVIGAQIIRALMGLHNETYNMVVHGKVYDSSMYFEEMDLSSIEINREYELRIDRKTDGTIEQVVYMQRP